MPIKYFAPFLPFFLKKLISEIGRLLRNCFTFTIRKEAKEKVVRVSSTFMLYLSAPTRLQDVKLNGEKRQKEKKETINKFVIRQT